MGLLDFKPILVWNFTLGVLTICVRDLTLNWRLIYSLFYLNFCSNDITLKKMMNAILVLTQSLFYLQIIWWCKNEASDAIWLLDMKIIKSLLIIFGWYAKKNSTGIKLWIELIWVLRNQKWSGLNKIVQIYFISEPDKEYLSLSKEHGFHV